MKTSKIVLGLSKSGDGALEDKALAVAAAMTGNTNFPDPLPALSVLNDSIKSFSDALAVSKTRDKVKVLIKNKLREELEVTLTNLAHYCSFIAKGDRAILASSGFSLNANTFATKTLSLPENFTVQLGNNSGEVILSVNTMVNSRAYLFLYGPAPVVDGAWLHATNSLPTFTITGLEPGKTYSFRIGVIGSKGQTVYTDIITRLVV